MQPTKQPDAQRQQAWQAQAQADESHRQAQVKSAQARQRFVQQLVATFQQAGVDLQPLLAEHAALSEATSNELAAAAAKRLQQAPNEAATGKGGASW